MAKMGLSVVWDYCLGSQNNIFAAAWGIYKNDGGIYEIINNEFVNRNSNFNINSKEIISLAYDSKFNKLFAGSKDNGLYEVDLTNTVQFLNVEGKSIVGFATTKNAKATLFNNASLRIYTESSIA